MTQIYSPKLEIQLVFSAIMVLKNYEERKPQSFHALIECSINNMEYVSCKVLSTYPHHRSRSKIFPGLFVGVWIFCAMLWECNVIILDADI